MCKKKKDEADPSDVCEYDGCIKVRDPCKICLQTVDSDEGLQCQGACEAWAHFECLNYTPGKILDVTTGVITVTCPCPDCKTTVPKEYLTEAPFACNNVQCPANNPPCCEDPYCQANELTRAMPARCPPPGTLRQCGGGLCFDNSGSPSTFQSSSDDACMEGYVLETQCGGSDGRMKVPMPPTLPTCPPPSCPPPCPPPPAEGNTRGGLPSDTADVMQKMCKTVGNLAEQLNCLMENLKKSCPPEPTVCGTSGSSCGGNAGCKKCSTPPPVITKKQCTGGCGSAGQSKCSDPCRCPGSPMKKV